MSTTANATTGGLSTPDAVAEMEAFFNRSAIAQAPAWRPDVNDVLVGVIIGFRMGSTVEYGEYPVIVVQTTAGPVSFHCFHGVVREALAEIQPKKGHTLTVQYLGQKVVNGDEDKAPQDQKRYHRYYIESSAVEATAVLDEMTF